MKERTEINLITTWLASERQLAPFCTLTDIVDQMNDSLNRHYRLSRIREWERGSRAPDPLAHNYVLSRALPYAIARARARGQSFSKPAIQRLLTTLSLPIAMAEA